MLTIQTFLNARKHWGFAVLKGSRNRFVATFPLAKLFKVFKIQNKPANILLTGCC